MRTLFIFNICLLLCVALLFSCKEEATVDEFTGRSLTYQLNKGVYLDRETSGVVTVREKSDKSLQIEINLEGTLDGADHPAHLHYGSLADDGEMAAMLEPVKDTGNQQSKSITILQHIEDGSLMDFDRFQSFDGSIKVHFAAAGELKDVILGSADIGSNSGGVHPH